MKFIWHWSSTLGKQQTDGKAQIERFLEAAREHETDDSEEAFDRALKKIAKAPPPKDDKKEAARKVTRTAKIWIAAGVVAAMVSGCTTPPADYAATLSNQDPKWQSPECEQIRVQALSYKERNLNWAAGLLIGPYGLAVVAAGKEHQEKQRKLLAREMHIRCSSLPLPKNLQINPSTTRKSNSS
jgi:hypothetical protein